MRITVTKTQDQITPDLNRALKEVEKVSEGAYKIFRSHTPIRSGNARSKTRLEGMEIQANYAYATRLDKGWSNQAPDGMTKPTEAWLKRTLDKIFRGR